jgi:hypothetical protein
MSQAKKLRNCLCYHNHPNDFVATDNHATLMQSSLRQISKFDNCLSSPDLLVHVDLPHNLKPIKCTDVSKALFNGPKNNFVEFTSKMEGFQSVIL